jgi:hypothetical protein
VSSGAQAGTPAVPKAVVAVVRGRSSPRQSLARAADQAEVARRQGAIFGYAPMSGLAPGFQENVGVVTLIGTEVERSSCCRVSAELGHRLERLRRIGAGTSTIVPKPKRRRRNNRSLTFNENFRFGSGNLRFCHTGDFFFFFLPTSVRALMPPGLTSASSRRERRAHVVLWPSRQSDCESPLRAGGMAVFR